MLINYERTTDESNVKFGSYTGEYPNLCSGVLTLLIAGQEVRFGNKFNYTHPNYDKFWMSGGNCGFGNNYSETYVNHGEWIIDAKALPDELRKYAAEIDEVFNANVPYGCCGGCL